MTERFKPLNPPPAFKDWEFEAGCYFDGARGVYLIDYLADFAAAKGFTISDCDDECCKNHPDPMPSTCHHSGELEDEIDDYMNSKFEIEGHSWGRSEQGDWGLWKNEDEDSEDADLDPDEVRSYGPHQARNRKARGEKD